MRPSVRTAQALGDTVILNTSVSFICRSCRHQAFRQHLAFQQQSRSASSNNLPFTEKIRRKIWGTDNPPGLADPYGGPSFLERRRMQREAESRGEQYSPNAHTRDVGLEAASFETDEVSVPEEPREYVPAENWDGLEHMGHRGDWKDVPPKPEDSYEPFTGAFAQKAETRHEIYSSLHRALVEVTTLQRAGMDLSLACRYREAGSKLDDEVLKAISTAKLAISADGTELRIAFTSEDLEQAILRRFEQLASDASTVDQVPEITDVVVDSEGDYHPVSIAKAVPFYFTAFEDIPAIEVNLADPTTFHIFKRFTQVSGHRIPDPVLSEKNTWQAIIAHMANAVVFKPKKLAEKLMQKQSLAGLPNLKIMGRRETPVDKEKEVGRWKVIEAELKSRGLPVLGRVEA